MNQLKKVPGKDIEDIIALTPIQEGMLFHYLKNPGGDYYFEQLCLTITGEIDFNFFLRAWALVVDSNEMLRTRFKWETVKKPVQIILKHHHPTVFFHDFSNKTPGEAQHLAQKVTAKDRKEKFHLNDVPFRVNLCKLAGDRYEMIVSNHHILYDGWSNGIILEEFFSAYHELVREKSPQKTIKHKYREYITWLQNQDREKQKKFWQRCLHGFDTWTGLSIKRKKISKENKNSCKPGNYHLQIPGALRDQLESFSIKSKITLAALFYSAWGLLLLRYNNSRDVIFGTTVSGRPTALKGIENMVGLFINTLPFRVRSLAGELPGYFLERLNRQLQEREAFEGASLVEIKEYSGTAPGEELFDTVLVVENYPLDRVLWSGGGQSTLRVDSYHIYETTHYDLTVGIIGLDEIKIDFLYNPGLFEETAVPALAGHYLNILQNLVTNPGQPLEELEILSIEEKNKILKEFNRTGMEFPLNKTIHQVFTEQVEKVPDHTAVIFGESRLTYRELNQRVEQMVVWLAGKGPGPGHIIGIMVERSLEMLIGILGILKAGAAYLPIEPGYPPERINYMLKDSSANILLTSREIANHSSPRASLNMSEGHRFTNDHLAYIIYTSGTTGKPKGVMIEHSAVMNRLYWVKHRYQLDQKDVILQATSFIFDVSVCELFRWIPAGARLCFLSPGGEKEPGLILETITRHRVTTADFVPAMLSLILDHVDRQKVYDELSSLRWVFTGVEVVGLNLVKKFNETLFKRNKTKLINAYGPTESTVDVTYFDCSTIGAGSDEVVPIGKPMANTRVYILDRNSNIQPIGVYGQLCISGAGLARGYLNNPELTAQKFDRDLWDYRDYQDEEVPFGQILNAFGEREAHELHELTRIKITPNEKFLRGGPGGAIFSKSAPPGRRGQNLYHTGDLALWQSDGNIRFLGRLDHQVKIRGFRVELGEIENQLLTLEKIKDAVVTAGERVDGEKYLCAYIVSTEKLNVSSLKEKLAAELPYYMIPAYIVQLERIPLTGSGNVDRKALPRPGLGVIEVEYAAPVNPLQERLIAIWSEVLNLERSAIGTSHNFFRLGGHSLTAIRLSAAIQKELQVDVPLEKIFQYPTVQELAGYMGTLPGKRYRCIELAEHREYYALSSAQKRIYLVQRLDPGSVVYHLVSVMELDGETRQTRLEETFLHLIKRHESLRTSFIMVGDEPVQRVYDEVPFEIENYDPYRTRVEVKEERSSRFEGTRGLAPLSAESHPSSVIRHLSSGFIRPFDLNQAPLLRAGIIKLEENKHILMVDLHHIICDGASVEILIKDFMVLYRNNGLTLPLLDITYKDFSRWQDRQKESEAGKRQEEYWKKEFSGEIPVLDLPFDFIRPHVKDFSGSTLGFEIGKEETTRLNTLAQETGATLFMTLLALFNVFLARISGQEEIVVGSPGAGRQHVQLENIVGMFVNTLALKNFPLGEKTFSQFLKEIKDRTLEAFAHQDYPYEELVEAVEAAGNVARNPLFDTAFVLQNAGTQEMEIPGLKIKTLEPETNVSKFDLTLMAEDTGESLKFTFEYCTKLFIEETIKRFTRYFKKIVAGVLARPHAKLSTIEIIPGNEKEEILYRLNDTRQAYPTNKTIHGLFARQAEKTPDRTALVEAHQLNEGTGGLAPMPVPVSLHVTYKELNHRSDRLARVLNLEGVKPDIIVGIRVERSIEMIIGILGILKAGGAYLPLNPQNPGERNKYMLNDSNVNILLTDREIADLSSPRELYLSAGHSFTNDQCPMTNDQLAYVIYTSGSTGKPKGTAITHHNICPLLHWGYHQLGLSPADHVIQNLSYFFDWSVWEIFITLTSGASLYITANDVLTDPEAAVAFTGKYSITVLHITPTQFQYFLNARENLETLEYLFLGAEKLTYDLVRRSYEKTAPHCRVFNMYGPTEAAIISATLELYPGDDLEYKNVSSVPIGKPSANARLLVLDKYMDLCPVNRVGELYIAGDGLARGYLNNPELSAEKFCLRRPGGRFLKKLPPWTPRKNFSLEGPYSRYHRSHWSYLSYIYRSGDLVRQLRSGDIEFLGRIDHQVKIRGYRIELGEIQNRLLAHEKIKEVEIIVREKTGKGKEDKYLCAYIVPAHGTRGQEKEIIDSTELQEYLSKDLPGYMIPSCFVTLEQMPLTPNGKIDRNALPVPDITDGTEYTAPKGEIETGLVELWADILSIEPGTISTVANFFELGGHSLKAAVLTSRIHKQFKVKISLLQVFENPNIKEIALLIQEAAASKFTAVLPAENKEYYPVSPAQKRLYILQHLDEQGTGYNIPSVLALEGDVDKSKLEDTFRHLIKRHESLRTSFAMIQGEPVQRLHTDVKFEMEYYQVEVEAKAEDSDTEGTRGLAPLSVEIAERHAPYAVRCASTIKNFIRPFDLSRAPLLRVELVKLPHTPSALPGRPPQEGKEKEDRFLLLVDMHHIISDGVSHVILVKDFTALYSEEHLPPLKIQYKDFSQWQNQWNRSENMNKQKEYWHTRFKNRDIPAPDLPLDYPRPTVRDIDQGDYLNFTIEKELSRQLPPILNETGTTIFMLLLAAYNILLSIYTNREEIVVGTLFTGRTHADSENVIGMFVNTLPIKNHPRRDITFNAFLKEVKESMLSAHENQGYPFDELVIALGLQGDSSRSPLFDTVFTSNPFNNEAAKGMASPGLKFTPYDFEIKFAKFDLYFQVSEMNESIEILLRYSTQLFKETTIRKLVKHYHEVLAQVAGKTRVMLKDIALSHDLLSLTPTAHQDDGSDFKF